MPLSIKNMAVPTINVILWIPVILGPCFQRSLSINAFFTADVRMVCSGAAGGP